MAKRFSDTDKWKKPFIRGLQGAYKLLWLYLLDDCDLAGVWQVDLEVASIRIGEKVTEKEALKFFAGRVHVFDEGTKWWIKDFCSFQYGELKETNRMHLAVIAIIKKNNLDIQQGASEPLPRGQGQGQGKGHNQGQGKGQEDAPDFSDYERWTKDIVSGNDWAFTDKVKNMQITVNGSLETVATSHLALLAKYPKMQPSDQNKFRISLIGHIQEQVMSKAKVIQQPRKKTFEEFNQGKES